MNQAGFFVADQYGHLSVLDKQLIGAPHNNTDTSIEAARQAADKAPTQKDRIVAFIEAAGPLTEDELEVSLRLLRSAVCARVNELVKQGILRDSGMRRLTRFGAKAVIWERTDKPYRLPVTGSTYELGHQRAQSSAAGGGLIEE